jgi:hypothetical protein
MNLQAFFRRAARLEYDEAAVWYETQKPGLGGEFVSEIERALLQACEMPQRFPKMLHDVRCIRVRRFPYSIFSVSETIGSSCYRYFTPGVIRWSGVSGRNNTFQTTCWMNAPERMRYAYKKSPEESYGEYGELLKEVFAQFRFFSPDVLSVA